MKNCNINELDGNQKSEGEDKNEVNSNKVNSEQKDSFRQFLAKQNAEDEKRQKRKRILINTIKYLSLNNVSVTDYLSKHAQYAISFPTKITSYAMEKFNKDKISVADALKEMTSSAEGRAEKTSDKNSEKSIVYLFSCLWCYWFFRCFLRLWSFW